MSKEIHGDIALQSSNCGTVDTKAMGRAANEKTLGASFFFSKDEDNRKTLKSFFTTLAYELSCHYPTIAEQTNLTLEGAPDVAERDPAPI